MACIEKNFTYTEYTRNMNWATIAWSSYMFFVVQDVVD